MSISTSARNDLVRLVVGMFDAAPGAAYLSALESQFEAGRPLTQMARELTVIAHFEGVYPASSTNAQFVDAFMGNMLGGQVVAGPVAWARGWLLDMLAAGMNRGEMILTAVQALDAVPASNTDWFPSKVVLDNRMEVANYYSVNKTQSSTDLTTLRDVINGVDGNHQTVVTAMTAIDADIAGPAPSPSPAPTPSPTPTPTPTPNPTPTPTPTPTPSPGTGLTFTLTAAADQGTAFAGAAGNDIYNSTYDAAVTDTFNAVDILVAAGGIDTLNISHIIDVAITPPDALWAGLSGFEKIVMNTTGNGAQTITTGANFEAAFAAGGVDFTTVTSGSGAIGFTLSSFTGAVTLVTTSLAGAQTILTGAGTTTVSASSTGGALTIQGAGLVGVTAVTTGAGAQTIISTSTQAVTVNSTLGEGALVIVTGSGNDTITLLSSDAAGSNLITANAGADTITLVAGPFAARETLVIGDADSGITVATADKVINFVTGSDLLKMGFAGNATAGTGNYIEAGTAVADFAAALVAANAALAVLNGTSGATELFAFQFDTVNGYLFNDANSDGAADQVIVLVGVSSSTFAAADIII